MSKAYQLAKTYVGTEEEPGKNNNPLILKWFAEVENSWVDNDEVAWCAAFVGAMIKESGGKSTKKLNARSYLNWGHSVELENAEPGDIVVFWRNSKNSVLGHVGFFVKEKGDNIVVLGGNQSDSVSYKEYPKDRLLGVRRANKHRKKVNQSSTIKATGVGGVSLIGTAITTLPSLDYHVQIMALGMIAITALSLAWIFRERLRKISHGGG